MFFHNDKQLFKTVRGLEMASRHDPLDEPDIENFYWGFAMRENSAGAIASILEAYIDDPAYSAGEPHILTVDLGWNEHMEALKHYEP